MFSAVDVDAFTRDERIVQQEQHRRDHVIGVADPFQGQAGAPPLELLLECVEESYRAVAPKTLVKELDARAG